MTSRSDPEHLSTLTDDELIDRFRAMKTEAGGTDPALTPPNDEKDPIRAELERRGLAPDREDVIPEEESPNDGQPD